MRGDASTASPTFATTPTDQSWSCMSLLDPADSCRQFAELLRELGVEPVVIGALAALRYRAEPRLTTDVDFLVPDSSGLADALEARGFDVDAHAEPGAAPHLLFVRGGGHKVDILAVETEYQAVAYERAIDGYLAPEDVVVHKLLAWRPRDRDDVASILEAGVALDHEYIATWADAWNVSDRWIEARSRP